MTEQEEFEKAWFKILIPGEYDSMDDFDKDRWRGAIRQSFDAGWQACAERKNAELEALREAAQDFVDKVERGEARSKRSYAKFKAALALFTGESL